MTDSALSNHQVSVPQDVAALQRERDHLQILVDVTNTVLSTLEIDDLVSEVAASIYQFFGVRHIGLDIFGAAEQCRSLAVDYSSHGQVLRTARDIPAARSLAGKSCRGKAVCLAEVNDLTRMATENDDAAQLLADGYRSVCILPLLAGERVLGALLLAQDRPDNLFSRHLLLLQQIAARIAMALYNALAYQEISRLKDQLANENQFLTEEIRSYKDFDEIVAQSAVMAAVLEQVEMVASSDCTVLILGETGTGKELIARAIHNLSARHAQRMVTVNCAAIPSGLLESDLFGHEKGAYTGAVSQRLGRFEMANHSTLFLDEIGDIPLELQPKLLRVLQEREIERLGGQKVISVDVRVIAATSCNLRQMVADRQYRSDLYYRLNVFPIIVPPLRDRPEDIPLLAKFFTQKIARRMNRNIESIPTETLNRLMRHPWPGNVRELENVIERAVILSRGPVLNLPLADLQYDIPAAPEPVQQRLMPSMNTNRSVEQPSDNEPERDKIIRILRETNGIVAGPKGAAARLGLKRTTLLSRMQRYGISVKSIQEMDASIPFGTSNALTE